VPAGPAGPGLSSMRPRNRNIYPIGLRPGGACLFVLALALVLFPSPARAQCEDAAGAGDEYCETLPGAGGDAGAGGGADAGREGGGPRPEAEGEISPGTARALERAGAGGVRAVKSPRGSGRPGASQATAPGLGATGDDGSALPYILAALTLALLLAALVRHRRSSTSGETPG
jgi:MYXO-CTERM domain-containing protein